MKTNAKATTKLAKKTAKPAAKKATKPTAPAKKAAAKTATPKVQATELVKESQVPLPAAAPPALPKAAPLPENVELIRDPSAKKRGYVSKTEPTSKYHLRDRSEAEKPVSIVRSICEARRSKPRKDVLALCIASGVNKNTAATQYSLWKKADLAKQLAAETGEDDNNEE